MARLLICGDPHSRVDHIIEAVAGMPPDAVILLADMTPERPLHEELQPILDQTDVWWIPGNHDTDDTRWYDNTFGSALANRNLHGRVIEIAGLRVADLGGVFRGKVWLPDEAPSCRSATEMLRTCGKGNRWRGGLPLRHRSTIFPEDVEQLSRKRADILVTHRGPGGDAYHRHCSPAITRLAQSMRVRAAFHGHHHANVVYPDGVWRQVGFRQTFLYEEML